MPGEMHPAFEAQVGKGRRGGTSLVSKELKRLLDEKPKGKSKTWAQILAKVLLLKAVGGSYPHMKELIERTEGKVPDRIAGADGGPVAIDVVLEAINRAYGKQDAVDVEARLLGPQDQDQDQDQDQLPKPEDSQ